MKYIENRRDLRPTRRVRQLNCHIEPDWVLVYRVTGDTICFERTGSHSDLFS
ncbi:MAG: type II toxin-antitoxin system mRNA interferase toxin, RelE/StbE family [Nitrospirae bacterium]|nr:type II toxin-antitoxin system mRNA interferase toxin, RelE/StbE family [Nitrospirota bacterium]